MKFSRQLLASLLLTACGCDASKELGDGYLHAETNLHNTWIIQGTRIVVDSNVANAVSIDDYILGLRVKPERFVDLPENLISDEYGYFLLDKTTGTLIEGLSRSEVEEIFQEHGWSVRKLDRGTLW